MEICLNALWFAISLLLVGWWLRGAHTRGGGIDARAGIAVLLLIVLSFPAISMTDDLLLLSAPAETEHMLRRVETSLEHAFAVTGPTLLAAALLCLALAALGCLVVARPTVRRRRWREVLERAAGVRPPPEMVPAI